MPYETQNEHNDAKPSILTQKITYQKMSKSTVENTLHAGRKGKFSELNNQQMDAEFEGGLLVQNSQTHPTFDFE